MSSGLVGYYDDSDDERKSVDDDHRDEETDTAGSRPSSTADSLRLHDSQMATEPDEEPKAMDVSPAEVQIVGEVAGDPSKQRSPFRGSYSDHFKRQSTPVNVDETVWKKYELMFLRKERGDNIDMDANKMFKNPALYDLVTDKCDVDAASSNLPDSVRVFSYGDFTDDDFHDRLKERQEARAIRHLHHKQASKSSGKSSHR